MNSGSFYILRLMKGFIPKLHCLIENTCKALNISTFLYRIIGFIIICIAVLEFLSSMQIIVFQINMKDVQTTAVQISPRSSTFSSKDNIVQHSGELFVLLPLVVQWFLVASIKCYSLWVWTQKLQLPFNRVTTEMPSCYTNTFPNMQIYKNQVSNGSWTLMIPRYYNYEPG